MLNSIFPPILAASVSLFVAALSATIALVSLIISKEQKVSEFRQNWIDALRSDLSEFVSAATSVHTQNQIFSLINTDSKMSVKEAFGKISLRLHDAYCSYHKIQLRLNPDEHQRLSERINRIERTLSNRDGRLTAAEFGDACAEFDREAQRVLKREWKRVKSGELTYRITKYAFVFILVAGFFGAAIFYSMGT